MSPSAGEYDYIVSRVFTHPRPAADGPYAPSAEPIFESYSLIIHRHDHLRDVVPDVVAFGSCVIFLDGCSHIDTDVEGFGHGKQAGLGPGNLAFANLFLGR